jgi:hypothetical protein
MSNNGNNDDDEEVNLHENPLSMDDLTDMKEDRLLKSPDFKFNLE